MLNVALPLFRVKNYAGFSGILLLFTVYVVARVIFISSYWAPIIAASEMYLGQMECFFLVVCAHLVPVASFVNNFIIASVALPPFWVAARSFAVVMPCLWNPRIVELWFPAVVFAPVGAAFVSKFARLTCVCSSPGYLTEM